MAQWLYHKFFGGGSVLFRHSCLCCWYIVYRIKGCSASVPLSVRWLGWYLSDMMDEMMSGLFYELWPVTTAWSYINHCAISSFCIRRPSTPASLYLAACSNNALSLQCFVHQQSRCVIRYCTTHSIDCGSIYNFRLQDVVGSTWEGFSCSSGLVISFSYQHAFIVISSYSFCLRGVIGINVL